MEYRRDRPQGAERHRPIVRPRLQRRRLSLHRQRTRLHDRRPGALPPARVRDAALQTPSSAQKRNEHAVLRHLHAEPGAAHAPTWSRVYVLNWRGHLLGEQSPSSTAWRAWTSRCSASAPPPAASPTASRRATTAASPGFPIEFQGVNARGWERLRDGFTPTCAVADDPGAPARQSGRGAPRGRAHVARQRACPATQAGPGAEPRDLTAALDNAGALVSTRARERQCGGRE